MAPVERNLTSVLHEAARLYPVVTVTGPRQSGKTTLCRAAFPGKRYVSLEPLDVREAARDDPRGFLAEHSEGAILDEIQHVPELPTYLQPEIDERPEPGRFILTGSQNFAVSQAVTQSLAGRTAMLHLLPLSLDEVRRFRSPPVDLWDTIWTGGYPRIHDRRLPASRWLADYVTTYVERDVRQVMRITDLGAFTTFVRLAAGRSGQELNLSSLGADAGISHVTARAWLSVLETSFLCFRVQAWHRNLRKREVKASKLHFFDAGLACRLLGIEDPGQLRHHPLRGALFETWVATEIYKARAHRGLVPRLFHYREVRGAEVDLVVERARSIAIVEAKSGATLSSDFLVPLDRLAEALAGAGEPRPIERMLVYGGETSTRRGATRVVPWGRIADVPWDGAR